MDKKIAGALLVGGFIAGAIVANVDDAEAKRLVAIGPQVDAASLASDYLELRKLPDAGVVALCRGVVAVEGDGGASVSVEAPSFESSDSTFINALGACDRQIKAANPKLQ